MLFVLALFVFVPASHAQSGPVVWVARSLQRIGPDDAPGSTQQAQLSAARGESESFQIVVRAPGSAGLSNVNVTVSDLAGPGGAVIPKRNLSLFREHYVYVGISSPNWGGSNRPLAKGWYPDGLIPFTDPQTGNPLSGAQLTAVPFSLNASKNQPIWVDVLVPRDATPGAYSGTFSVTSNQGNVSGQISLTVWNFTLPMKPALGVQFPHLDDGQHGHSSGTASQQNEPPKGRRHGRTLPDGQLRVGVAGRGLLERSRHRQLHDVSGAHGQSIQLRGCHAPGGPDALRLLGG